MQACLCFTFFCFLYQTTTHLHQKERKKERTARQFFSLPNSTLARSKLIRTYTPIHKEKKKSASLSCLAEKNAAVASGTTTAHHFRMCIFTSTESKEGRSCEESFSKFISVATFFHCQRTWLWNKTIAKD